MFNQRIFGCEGEGVIVNIVPHLFYWSQTVTTVGNDFGKHLLQVWFLIYVQEDFLLFLCWIGEFHVNHNVPMHVVSKK